MAITPDWITKTFTVPQGDLTLVTGTLYEMDTEVDFRQQVNAIMASEEGIVFEDPIRHNTEVTIAGLTLARVIEMINGYSLVFSPDSQWSVRYTGSNNNLFDIENGVLDQNQVQVIPNNSAGLIALPRILSLTEANAYGGAIHIDAVNGNDANDGTPDAPVQTAAAAKIRADLLKLQEYHFKGSITLTSAHDRWNLVGQSAAFNDVVNLNNQSVDESRFQGCQLSGDATESSIEAVWCELDNPGNLYGIFRQCGLLNTFKVEALTPRTYVFHHCFSQVAGPGRPALDFTNVAVTHNVQFRNYVGGMNVRNMVQGNLSLDVVAGTVDLESTITGGAGVVRGEGLLIENYGGTFSLINGMVEADDFRLMKQLLGGKVVVSVDDLTVTVYDEDLTTVLLVLDVTADGRTRTPQ